MAQAAWVPSSSSSDRRPASGTPMATSPQPLELARWELAEFLKSSSNMSREPVHPQSQAMFGPPSLNSVFTNFGNNADTTMSSMTLNQGCSHNGSVSNSSNRGESLNTTGQQYEVFSSNHPTSAPNDGYRSTSSSNPNYVIAAPGVYGNGSLHDGLSTFHNPNSHAFSMSSNMSTSFAQKLTLDQLDSIQRPHDFSYSDMPQNHAAPSIPDLRRLSTNGFASSGFPDDFGIGATSSLGMGLSPLNMQSHLHLQQQQQQQQQQFSDGYGRFPPEGQYTPSPDRSSVTSHFSPTHSNSEMSPQTNSSFPHQQNFDGMPSYMSGAMGTNPPNAGLATSIVENGAHQNKLQATSTGTNDFQSFIRYVAIDSWSTV
jgi:hypothetical protein